MGVYVYESWTIKKAELWRIDAFELWCWRRLESLLDCKEIKSVNCKWNQSWIFVGRTDAEVEAPMFWPPDWKSWLIIKYPDAEKIEGSRRRGQWRMRYCMASLTHWTWVWASSGRWWRTGKAGFCSPWGHKELDMTVTEHQQPFVVTLNKSSMGLPWWSSSWDSAYQCAVCGFHHWSESQDPRANKPKYI